MQNHSIKKTFLYCLNPSDIAIELDFVVNVVKFYSSFLI